MTLDLYETLLLLSGWIAALCGVLVVGALIADLWDWPDDEL